MPPRARIVATTSSAALDPFPPPCMSPPRSFTGGGEWGWERGRWGGRGVGGVEARGKKGGDEREMEEKVGEMG